MPRSRFRHALHRARTWVRPDGKPNLARLRRLGLSTGPHLIAETGVIIDASFPWLIRIGESCTLSTYVTIYAHDASTRRSLGYTRVAPVVLGDRVYVGSHAVILPGVTIGDDVVVGAGSVVTKDVPAGTVVAGVPARHLGAVQAMADVHRARLADDCRWTRAEGTVKGGISEAGRRAMAARVEQLGYGYVE